MKNLIELTPIEREAMEYLLHHGCNGVQAQKFLEEYCQPLPEGFDPVEYIKENAYALYLREVIPFDAAERIEKDRGAYASNRVMVIRILATLHDRIGKYMENTGSVWGNADQLIAEVMEDLHIANGNSEENKKPVYDAINQCPESLNLIIKQKGEEKYITWYRCAMREETIACGVRNMLYRNSAVSSEIATMTMEREGRDLLAYLDEDQKEAVRTAVSSKICIIAGGPGTGKSFVIKTISDLISKIKPNYKIKLMASTGKAAQNLQEKSGYAAKTIHHELRIVDGMGYEGCLQNSFIAVDEMSMVDEKLMETLVNKINYYNCQLVLVGDPDQLPSVGAGAVLRDLIQSGRIPVCYLNNCHRQREGSGIIKAASLIRQGNSEIDNTDDFQIETCNSEDVLVEKFVLQYEKGVERYGLQQVMGLVATHGGKMGDINLNHVLQERLNPERDENAVYSLQDGNELRVGDRVIHTNHNLDDVKNGEIGHVTAVEKSETSTVVKVQFQNGLDGSKEVFYHDEECEDLKLAYVITIHKAQGSQCKCVIMGLKKDCRLNTRNLLYTGITRAEEQCFLYVNGTDTLKKTIENPILDQRITFLSELI